jgi:hypothetical protein
MIGCTGRSSHQWRVSGALDASYFPPTNKVVARQMQEKTFGFSLGWSLFGLKSISLKLCNCGLAKTGGAASFWHNLTAWIYLNNCLQRTSIRTYFILQFIIIA